MVTCWQKSFCTGARSDRCGRELGRGDSLKEKIATAFVIDATDEQALSVLPLNSVDVVIVAIGEISVHPSV